MKKFLSIFLLILLSLGSVLAQESVLKTQGIPRPDIKIGQSKTTKLKSVSKAALSSTSTQENVIVTQGVPRPELQVGQSKAIELRSGGKAGADFTFDDIRFWVGEGENQAALVIDWYDNKGTTLVWGYQWDGTATGFQMIEAIAKEDPRLLFFTHYTGGMGNTIAGFGYDLNNSGGQYLIYDGDTENPYYPVDGIVTATAYNYDSWTNDDPEDHWQSGWYEGYWSYQVKDSQTADFDYSGLGASSRQLQNGSWDGWGYQDGWDSWTGVLPQDPYVAVLPMTLDYTETTLYVEDNFQLTSTVYQNSYVGQTITWSSSDNAIATIDQNGNITAVSQGTVTITAKINDDCYAECDVTVNVKPFTFDDIVFWVGEGDNEAMLVVDWYDGKGSTLAWGYRWNGTATGSDMVTAIAAADPRFTFMGGGGTIGGMGYDVDNNGSGCIVKGETESCPVNGIITVGGYNYDGWTPKDATDHWQSGWMSGYWSYHVKNDVTDDFEYSNYGFASRQLTNGSVDGWGYQEGWDSWTGMVPRAPFEAATMPEIVSLEFDDVVYWVGEGEKQTGVAIKWNDGKSEDALIWGYRWDGEKKVIDMLKDIAYEDERFYILLNETNSVVIGGIGFDLNGENTTALIYNNLTTYPLYPFEGIVKTTTADFDKYVTRDTDDHWCAGITENGIWNYLVMEEGQNIFTASSESILDRVLAENSWNAWNFDTEFTGVTLGNDFTSVSEYTWKTIDYTKGIFFVNEDWFGHTNGSVNFLKENGEWVYRAYTRENRGDAFGCTTQFGTIYGDNFYFVSKQAADGGDTQFNPGGRLVIADAKTLENKANFDVLGTVGDGRSFLGVNETTGYIGGNGGIALFDIENLTIGDIIPETGGGSLYSGQIGTMLRIGDYVFACKQSKGILVIDAKTHTVKETIECSAIGSIVQSKDGYLWASAYASGLWKINPYTLEVEEKIAIPTAAQIPSTWGAWTSGVLAASEKTNTIYWAKMNGSTMTFFGTKVFKYDIDNDDVEDENFLSIPFYELNGYDGKEAFYGAGINVNPATDELIITTTCTGYGANYQKNRVHILDAQTAEVKNIHELNDYYWFPAMSVFPDNNAPIVSNSLADITIEEETKIFLGDKVSDGDNRNAAIIKSIISISDETILTAVIRNDSLIISPQANKYGDVDVALKFNSNGKTVTKTITISIEDPTVYVTSIALNKTSATITEGETLQLSATITPEDATNKNVIWSSSDDAVATVDTNGEVIGIAVGEATITATTEDGGFTAECVVTVIIPVSNISLNKTSATLIEAETLQLIATITPDNATNKNVTWSSSDDAIATVDANGLVTAIAAGEAIITVTTEDGGLTAECVVTVERIVVPVISISLNKTTLSLTEGDTETLIASINPDNADNKNITWSSNDEAIATVSANGLITAIAAGEATITVTTEDGGFTAECIVTVNALTIPVADITLNEANADMTVGQTLQLAAIITPDNATNKNVIWSSGNEAIATVDANGLVTGISEGTVIITATSENGLEASCEITVSQTTVGIEDVNEGVSIYVDALSANVVINTDKAGLASIYNVSGRMVLNSKINAGESRVDISNLNKGIYIVRFNEHTLKFIKK